MSTDRKIHYKRNILISIILSEVLIISAFIFSPKESLREEKILFDEPVILFDNMPRTVQSKPIQISKPDVPPIIISDEVEVFEPLDDVNLLSNAADQTGIVSTDFADQSALQSIRSVPRQIFEVVPAGGDNEFNGRLQLSLKIDKNGRVVDHRILYNSLDCTACLNDIIKAAYRSKWEPATVDGKNADYWVVKSYMFN